MRDLDSIALDRQCSSCLHLGCAGSNDGGGTSHKSSQVGKGGGAAILNGKHLRLAVNSETYSQRMTFHFS
jgi:hypothetical protein